MTLPRLTIACVVTGATALCGCYGNQSMFNPQGPAAKSIANLGWLLIAVTAVVYMAVMVALAIALMRRRRDSDHLPATTKRLGRNVTLAAGATAIVLVGLAVMTFAADRGLNSPNGPGVLSVDVIGHQWWWEFQYRDPYPPNVVSSPNELHIPVGVRVVLNATSRDVIHSFWAPNLHGKRDLIPGEVTHTWIQADQPGVYRGQCAEFCGHQHAHMAFIVVAEPRQAFDAWLQHQRQPAGEPPADAEGEAIRRGRELFMQGPCVTCHTIRGTDAGARLGPDLTHIGSRQMLAAGTLPNTREHLATWVTNAQAPKPGNRMPPIALEASERDALLAYLRSLR